jgi:hydrogenase expression/formation protein HypC
MCLAIPGQVTEIRRENEVLMGKVDFSGIRKEVCLDLIPGVAVGEYVLVHVGFALAKVDAVQAAKIFEALAELQQLGELEVPGT